MTIRFLGALFVLPSAAVASAQSHSPAVDSVALQRLVSAAEASHSDALVVLKDGRPVGEWYFGKQPKKTEAMSVTKSIVNLAIGRLVTTGAIGSIDDSVHKYYPEWRQGRKKDITIRHLLTHTSGLQDVPSASAEIYSSPDFVQLALAAELSFSPGERFFYSNKAVNLLPGIVQKASGKRLDTFLREDLFAALGISDFGWTLDSAGNPHGMAGLQILPADLAKLGQLVLDRGTWSGRQLISRAWFDEIDRGSASEPRAGLLWWRLPDRRAWIIDDAHIQTLARAGVDTVFLRRLRTIRGRYESLDAYSAALRGVFGVRYWETTGPALAPVRMSLARSEYGPMIGYEANGYLGQYLLVLPVERVVAVRMIGWSDRYRADTDALESFGTLVRALRRR